MQSESEPTLTEGSGKPPTKSCVCGNKMSGADSHSACIRCLGLEHTKAALAIPATPTEQTGEALRRRSRNGGNRPTTTGTSGRFPGAGDRRWTSPKITSHWS